jgi:recombinational DNA repair ATPase RecF
MGAPFLRRIEMLPDRAGGYSFNVRASANGIDLTLSTAVAFLVGENGSGKSTLLEALAECIIARPSPTARPWRLVGPTTPRWRSASPKVCSRELIDIVTL